MIESAESGMTDWERSGSNDPERGWMVRPLPRPQARLRLLCLAHAGGSASSYWSWGRMLPAGIEVVAVQLPGRGATLGMPACTSVEELVTGLTHTVGPLLDKPLAIFGHSMGALLGFELARAMRRAYGVSPLMLFASGHAAPQRARRRPTIHKLPAPQFWEEIRRLDGTPDEVLANPELMEIVEPALRADFAACETYVYKHDRPLDCPIAAFRGLNDPNTDLDDVETWGYQTEAGFSTSVFGGGHFFIAGERARVLAAIRHELRTRLGVVLPDTLARSTAA